MIVQENVELSKYTTIKIGGIAEKMYIPENEEEIVRLFNEKKPIHYLGGGSNLLIDNGRYDIVVNLKKFNTSLAYEGNGEYIIGASVRLQDLIRIINKDGYGGIEYLYSVPGLVGGAIVMNAGRGKNYNKCISDFIVSVKVLYNNHIFWMNKDECLFRYRSSIFKQSGYLVLEAKMKFDVVSLEESNRLRKERLDLCKRVQDNSRPNFGSVFSTSNSLVMSLMQNPFFGKKGGIMFSTKTKNWLLNSDGTFDDAIFLLNKVEKIHRYIKKPCEREVIVWESGDD